jgi:hypothetical protein
MRRDHAQRIKRDEKYRQPSAECGCQVAHVASLAVTSKDTASPKTGKPLNSAYPPPG